MEVEAAEVEAANLTPGAIDIESHESAFRECFSDRIQNDEIVMDTRPDGRRRIVSVQRTFNEKPLPSICHHAAHLHRRRAREPSEFSPVIESGIPLVSRSETA